MPRAWHLSTSAGAWLGSSWLSLSPLALNLEQDKALEAQMASGLQHGCLPHCLHCL